jgi:hypothetical protein
VGRVRSAFLKEGEEMGRASGKPFSAFWGAIMKFEKIEKKDT